MMNLAELHISTGGPLDELTDAIESVIEDIDAKTEKAHTEYDDQTARHEAEVVRINA
jgi:hypothetical protein